MSNAVYRYLNFVKNILNVRSQICAQLHMYISQEFKSQMHDSVTYLCLSRELLSLLKVCVSFIYLSLSYIFMTQRLVQVYIYI